MNNSKISKIAILKIFFLIMVGFILLFTTFFFPSCEPGSVINLSSFKEITRTQIVKLSPVFGQRGKKLYSIVLSPNIKKYAKDVSSSESVALVQKDIKIEADGTISSSWTFDWFYWFYIDVIPSMFFTCVILSVLRQRIGKLRRNAKRFIEIA
jgi:hypothetical protein